MKRTFGLLVLLSILVLIFGCAASYQARSVSEKESPLVNPDIFVKGKKGEALYRFINPKVNIKDYDKVMIDPVTIYKDGDLNKEQLKNYQTLANNAYVYFTYELKKDYQIVTAPEPGTMRVQFAIIDADPTKPVRNTLSTIIPIGMALSVVKLAAVGEQAGVGEITTEIKVTDASTGELMGAALDRRVGGKDIKNLWGEWYNADEALKYWAKRYAYVLCTMRGGTNCVKP